MIHIPRLVKDAHKNAADIRLAVDAMETLMTHPEVGVFVLVTSDSDYTPTGRATPRVRQARHRVGTQANASTHLVQACSEYKFWATIVARVKPDAPPATSSASASPTPSSCSTGRSRPWAATSSPHRVAGQSENARPRPILRGGQLRLLGVARVPGPTYPTGSAPPAAPAVTSPSPSSTSQPAA